MKTLIDKKIELRISQSKERLGEENINHFGSRMKIIEYFSHQNITVLFTDHNYITHNRRYDEFKDGRIKSLFDKTVYNVGYLGVGDYPIIKKEQATKANRIWRDMIRRCYSEESLLKRPTYKGCSVSEDWLCYQNFAKWFDKNYYEIEGEQMHLDKDILVKGNKVYSPDNCVFVPNNINVLFIKSDSKRGEYPIGVCYNKRSNNFSACCHMVNKKSSKHIGYYKTPEDAFYLGYKPFKENHIKEVADYYKDQIQDKLYRAMYNYIVEITD